MAARLVWKNLVCRVGVRVDDNDDSALFVAMRALEREGRSVVLEEEKE